jgi:hypothetical protein
MEQLQTQLDRIEAKIDYLLSIIDTLDNEEPKDNDLTYGERDQTQPL